jgi:hypothetical protein
MVLTLLELLPVGLVQAVTRSTCAHLTAWPHPKENHPILATHMPVAFQDLWSRLLLPSRGVLQLS